MDDVGVGVGVRGIRVALDGFGVGACEVTSGGTAHQEHRGGRDEGHRGADEPAQRARIAGCGRSRAPDGWRWARDGWR